jgi:hypothetical protein
MLILRNMIISSGSGMWVLLHPVPLGEMPVANGSPEAKCAAKLLRNVPALCCGTGKVWHATCLVGGSLAGRRYWDPPRRPALVLNSPFRSRPRIWHAGASPARYSGRVPPDGKVRLRTDSGASLSRRQAYRYLELARAGRPAPPVAENSITITLKMPESLAGDVRAHASKHDLTTSEVIRRAVAAARQSR